MESESLGAAFWLRLLGMCLAIGVAAGLIFLLFGAAWYAWGAIGTLVVVGGGSVLVAGLLSRVEARRRGDAGR
jgi:hypothetical protein